MFTKGIAFKVEGSVGRRGEVGVGRRRLVVLALTALFVFASPAALGELNVVGRHPKIKKPKKLPKLRGKHVQSTGTYHALSTGQHTGNLIHPDPDDPSDRVFITVEPEEVTITAGESAQFDISVTFQDGAATCYVASSAGFPGTGFDYDTSRVRLTPSNSTCTMEVFPLNPNSVVPGTYEFYVYGLASGNQYTEHATFTIVVEAPPTPLPTANIGTVTIEESLLNVFNGGTFAVDGDDNEVGAMYDNENDNVVNVEPNGSPSVIYPRWPFLFQNGSWTLQTGRGYADNARLIIWAKVNSSQFVAVHMNVAANGDLTPALLLAGDLNADGIVLSTDAFEFQMTGNLPGSGAGRLQGTVDGVPMFIEPNLSGNVWANRVTFEFDVPVYND